MSDFCQLFRTIQGNGARVKFLKRVVEMSASKKRIFVTGSQGFVGSKLCLFLEHNNQIVCRYAGKIEDFSALSQALNEFEPEVVIHLAAVSNVPVCEKNIELAYNTNVSGTSILIESLLRLKTIPHLIFASSAQVYNMNSPFISEQPLTESFELGPNNVYGRTKLLGENIVIGSAQASSLKAIVLRIFNHSHKDQDPQFFFLPSMYQQIAQAADGGTIKVGNLDVSRDFSLISDLLKAIFSVVTSLEKMDKIEIFNLCSGQTRNLKEMVRAMAKMQGKVVHLEVDPTRIRLGEAKIIVGDGNKLRIKTGYNQPKRSIEEYLSSFIK